MERKSNKNQNATGIISRVPIAVILKSDNIWADRAITQSLPRPLSDPFSNQNLSRCARLTDRCCLSEAARFYFTFLSFILVAKNNDGVVLTSTTVDDLPQTANPHRRRCSCVSPAIAIPSSWFLSFNRSLFIHSFSPLNRPSSLDKNSFNTHSLTPLLVVVHL